MSEAALGLQDVLPSAYAALGEREFADRLELGTRLAGARRVLVLLVDGLGARLLPAAAAHSPVLASVLAGTTGTLTELTAPFPSTTPTSLVTLGTGVLPGQHGVLGFTVAIPGTDRVLTHVGWRDDPPPHEWQPVPTVFRRATGTASSAVLPAQFAGSGLTEAAYRDARFVAVAAGDDLADVLLRELSAADGPRLVLGYLAALDTAAHVHGLASPQWRDAVVDCDALLERLIAGLPGDAALMVTADHGAFDVSGNGRLDLADEPALQAGLRLVAGEPRARYLHTRAGAEADVLAAWQERLGARATVLLREDAIARGWFGPVEAAALERIGDVVVVCTGDNVVLASGHEPPQVARLVAFHGGRDDVEVAIPLLTVRG